MFASGDTETVEWLRPPEKDRWGDPIPGTGQPLSIPGCLFAPGPTAENLNGANQTEADGTLYIPPDAPINPADITSAGQFRVRGDVYEVIGKPRVWGNAGVEIVLRMVTG
ncbi:MULTISPECIES: hypothetical protein [unclassified Micromonospora]|uniref:hypothetical protein n=1 Tax=unclassified Micromonospora TaxID=2617518 RepID=UPI0033279AB8